MTHGKQPTTSLHNLTEMPFIKPEAAGSHKENNIETAATTADKLLLCNWAKEELNQITTVNRSRQIDAFI